jgi:hypothetical protein
VEIGCFLTDCDLVLQLRAREPWSGRREGVKRWNDRGSVLMKRTLPKNKRACRGDAGRPSPPACEPICTPSPTLLDTLSTTFFPSASFFAQNNTTPPLILQEKHFSHLPVYSIDSLSRKSTVDDTSYGYPLEYQLTFTPPITPPHHDGYLAKTHRLVDSGRIPRAYCGGACYARLG